MGKDAEQGMLARISQLEIENSTLMTELNRMWAEVDRRRSALEKLTTYPDTMVSDIARAGLA